MNAAKQQVAPQAPQPVSELGAAILRARAEYDRLYGKRARVREDRAAAKGFRVSR
jgi:hypothetical protein